MFNRPGSAIASGLFFLLILFPLVVYAESFPTPGSRLNSSLLGIPARTDSDAVSLAKMKMTVDGPGRSLNFTLGTDDWNIHWFRVSPGTYRIDAGVDGVVIEVPPGVIMVSDFRIALGIDRGEPVIRFEDVDEEDRQKAALKLSRYVDFPEWRGREFLGFGSLRPEVEQEQVLYKAVLESDPTGAEIYLDDRLAGTSPLTLNLESGKHKILFRADGREDLTRYVRLNGDALIQVELPPAADSPSGHETYRTLIGPFYSEGEVDEQINTLFVDTLEIALEDDPRLTLIRSDIPWDKLGNLAQPDFSILEETGADLVVTGTFMKEGNQLMVQANLYDIQAESVKTGIFWAGDVGFSIFDAMDAVAERFLKEVDRVLPPAGRVLITRSEVVYGALSEKEQGISRKQIINQRWKAYPDSLNVQTGISALLGEYVYPSSNVQIPLVIDWSRDITPLFQSGAGGIFHFDFNRTFSGSSPLYFMDIELYGGVRLMFRSLRTDMSFGLSGALQYTPEYSAYSTVYGNYLSIYLPVDFRFLYYFTDNLDKHPMYFISNISFSFFGYSFDLSGRKQNGRIGLSALISFGVGMRL